MDEILLVDKPAGWTSFDVVNKLRATRKHAYLATGVKPTKRKIKVGHAGTLDPFATGLLVILLSDATKKADTYLKLDKVYEAEITLGQVSTTGDPEGELTNVSNITPSIEQIEDTLKQFTGTVEQTPPQFSAIKINGRRAYDLARKGDQVEMPTRKVEIHSLELLSYDYPKLTVRTHVASGTYIRSLAIDIGETLSTGAYCSNLKRTSIADMELEDALDINGAIDYVSRLV